MYLPESSFVRVINDRGGPNYTGGDQSWLEKPLSRKTSCGGIALLNMLCSLTGRTGPMEKGEYLDLYRSVFPMALSGFIPFARCFARRLKKLLALRGIGAETYSACSLTSSPAIAFAAITDSLARGLPAALQNWGGAEKPVRPYHWVTVLGVEGEKPESAVLLVSSWGSVYRYPLSSCWRGKASLVTVKLT